MVSLLDVPTRTRRPLWKSMPIRFIAYYTSRGYFVDNSGKRASLWRKKRTTNQSLIVRRACGLYGLEAWPLKRSRCKFCFISDPIAKSVYCSRFWKEDREGREFNSSPNKSSILEEKWSRHAKSHNSSVSETPSDAAPRPQKPWLKVNGTFIVVSSRQHIPATKTNWSTHNCLMRCTCLKFSRGNTFAAPILLSNKYIGDVGRDVFIGWWGHCGRKVIGDLSPSRKRQCPENITI